ncbi:MAG: hypothetical protein U1G08_22190 [Verrucomicrobiota bacterium]
MPGLFLFHDPEFIASGWDLNRTAFPSDDLPLANSQPDRLEFAGLNFPPDPHETIPPRPSSRCGCGRSHFKRLLVVQLNQAIHVH